MITLTRRYRFPASHRLHVPTLSEAENSRLFGKCNNPFGHGHDYVLSVTIAGEVEEETGLLFRTQDLDQLVESKILLIFAYRNLNTDVPQLGDLVPTTENLALVIATLLEQEWQRRFSQETNARLWRVHLQETDRNGFEVLLSEVRKHPALIRTEESVVVNG